MASVNITSTAQPVTIPAGTPVTVSAACTLGVTQAGAASGPAVSGNFTWPGIANPDYPVTGNLITLWIQTATTATLSYLS